MACQSLLDLPVRHGARRRGVDRRPAEGRLLLPGGGILSPDGHCRAFDAAARGTVGGNGVGRRGAEAADRRARRRRPHPRGHPGVRRSTTTASLKVGYTAPSVDGQAQVIAMAQAIAGVQPETISYVEAHGTGNAARRSHRDRGADAGVSRRARSQPAFCAIGSVKTNIGHLDCGAGVAGLIKTVLALEHARFRRACISSRPNPKIDFANSPFYVNTPAARRGLGPPRRAAPASARSASAAPTPTWSSRKRHRRRQEWASGRTRS